MMRLRGKVPRVGDAQTFLLDFRRTGILSVDRLKESAYFPYPRTPKCVVVRFGDVDDSMQDARNAGVCLTLKVYVQTLQMALGFLLSDLENHAWECRRERIHKFLTAKRHRKAIDEAIQRFYRMTRQIPIFEGRENSVRLQALERIADFYKSLPSVLPALDYPNSGSSIDVKHTEPIAWRERLLQSAIAMDSLACALGPLKTELDSVLEEKSRICREIESSMQKMANIL
jgi:hypothetical protein